MLKRVLSQILTSSDHNLRIISKRGKRFAKKVDFKEIKFPVKIRDNHKIEKLAFFVMKTKKNIQSMCQKILSKDMLIDY